MTTSTVKPAVSAAVDSHSINVLSLAVCEAARKANTADNTANTRWASFAELAAESGLIASYCISPPKTKAKETAAKPFNRNTVVMLRDLETGQQVATNRGEVYDDINNLAFSFLPAVKRTLLDTPTAGLSEAQKQSKRVYRGDQGSIVSRMQDKLSQQETGEKKRKPSRNATVQQRVMDDVERDLEWIGADENPTYDLNEVIRGLHIAKKGLSTTAPNS